MNLVFLVEEVSMDVTLRALIQPLLGADDHIDVEVSVGKDDLLRKLPDILGQYARWLPKDGRIVVLVDEDRTDCLALKARLERIARRAGLTTRSRAADDGSFQVLNRIVVEELEAWFFGDVEALRAALPRVPKTLAARRAFRDPDAIRGGTSETLWQVLRSAGYYRRIQPKVDVARRVAPHMVPERNRSHSFQVFWNALLQFIDPEIRHRST